jgi:uncharacterized repeat protein (TIGR01451 family)
MNRIPMRTCKVFATVLFCATLGGCFLSSEQHTSSAPPQPIPETAAAPAPAPAPAPVAAAPTTRPAAVVAAVPTCDNSRLYYPTGDAETSMLLLERKAAAQPRVGKPYNYQLTVTNLTNTPLRGVAIQEMLPNSFSTEANGQAAAPTTNPSMTDMAMNMSNDKMAAMTPHTHMIGELGPKESRTINLSGIPSQAGTLNTCTTVTCNPTLCTACPVINPQMRLSKQALGSGDLCEAQTIRYTVTNTGTGDLSNVRIDDQLPDGLTTETGGYGRVSLNVGTLAQGATRSLDVKVKANAAGSFSSAASAMANDDVTAKSDALAMAIKAPQLEVSVKAPDKEYLGDDVKYEVTVKNVGDAIARSPMVRIDALDAATAAGNGNGNGAQLASARINGQPMDHSTAQGGQSVGELAPGASKTVTIAYTPKAEGDFHINAIASDPCAAKNATAPAVTKMASIPALLLSAVDDHDPVRVGENVTYTITVLNQGFGSDKDIKVVATLPDAETYVSSSGASDGKIDGNKLTFDPVDTIAPKQTLTWKVVVKAAKVADVRFRVDMSSASFPDAAVKMEPTRLY